ncbi:hypothetical protein DFH28DRAFT_909166 [Melampsora americana]|nr:hypothetical protein DFH28DRAFT_909166 [Melampsora americana]
MTGKRKVPSFKTFIATKLPKNATPLQKAFYLRRKAELVDIHSRAASRKVTQGSSNSPVEQIAAEPTEDGPGRFNDEPDGADAGNMDVDPSPWEDVGVVEDEEPIVSMLNASYAQAKRLEQEKRWIRQYELNLPLFLASRDRTSYWANPVEAFRDTKLPCDCRGKDRRVRMVDLLDIGERSQRLIDFCACQSDQGRLIQMGYMGASPVHPKTGFSLHLLHIHHILWKWCCVRTEPFANALDEWLDAFCPPITGKNNQRRDWRKPLVLAADAYRRLTTAVRLKEMNLLKMNELDRLAANCPRCFGPPAPEANTEASEPDIVCCCDGNFQQRRHLAASVPIPGFNPAPPELFLEPEKVETMAEAIRGARPNKDDELVVSQ